MAFPYTISGKEHKDLEEAIKRDYGRQVSESLADPSVKTIVVRGLHGIGRWIMAQYIEKTAKESGLFDVVVSIRIEEEELGRMLIRALQMRIAKNLEIDLPSEEEEGHNEIQNEPHPKTTRKIFEALKNRRFLLIVGDATKKIEWEQIGLPIYKEQWWDNDYKIVTVTRYAARPKADLEIKFEADLSILLLSVKASNIATSLSDRGYHLAPNNVLDCFFYLPLFPSSIKSERLPQLLKYWLAEGLVQNWSEDWDVLENMFKALLKEFVDESLIHSINYVPPWIGQMVSSTLRRWEGKVPRVVGGVYTKTWEEMVRISLSIFYLEKLISTPECPKLITLLLTDNLRLEEISDAFFEHMPKLRILDISYTKISHLPSSISCLENLRLLQLSNCSCLQAIPCNLLQALKNLELLDLQGTPLEEIPQDCFESLQNLRYLDLSRTLLKDVPEECFKSLQKLRYLDLTNTKISSLPSSISILCNLNQLLLRNCENLTPELSLGALDKLCVLDLSGSSSLEKISFTSLANLNKLRLEGCRRIKTVMELLQQLQGLVELVLRYCDGLQDIQDVASSIRIMLPDLQNLDLSYTKGIVRLPLRGHPSLENISLEGLQDLELLDLSATKIKEFPYKVMIPQKLKRLDMIDVKNLLEVNWRDISWLPEEMNVNQCGSGEHEGQDRGGAFIAASKAMFFNSLDPDSPLWNCGLSRFHLCISSCEERANVNKCVLCRLLKDKKFLYNEHYCQIQTRPFPLTYYERHLELRIVHDRTARTSLRGVLSHTELLTLCGNSSFERLSAKTMEELKESRVENCNLMESIFYGESAEFDQLRHLENMWLSSLSKLTKVCEGSFGKDSFALLKHIYIDCCPRLVYIFSSSLCLPSLDTLEINFCARLEAIFQGKTTREASLQHLQVLCLRGLPKLKSVCNVHLPWTIKKIEIKSCPMLRKLPLPIRKFDGDSHGQHGSIRIEGQLSWWNKLQWEDESIKKNISFQEWLPFAISGDLD